MTDQPARYRRTPAEIEAVQWTGTNADALRAFCGPDFDTIAPEDRIEDPDQDAQVLVEASHWVGIGPTDWVVKFEGYFVAKADATFRTVWEPAAPVLPSADRAAEPEPETDEQRVDREATERDHARGDHTYCGITCEVEMPTEHLRNFVIAKGYPGTAGALDELLRRASVLPAPADRAAVLREAADAVDSGKTAFPEPVRSGASWAARMLRRMADEACGNDEQDDGLRCVCGLRAVRSGDEWVHEPGEGGTCLYRPKARPRCPDCGTPHDLTPSMALVCASIRASIADRHAAVVRAAEPADIETQFGVPGCTCRPFTRRGGVGRYLEPRETVDMISGWERGLDCPHHRAAEAQQDGAQA